MTRPDEETITHEPARASVPSGPRRVRRLPNALGAWREIAGRIRGRRLALFLDYDGTLAPVASRPELAVLSADMRAALEAVARVWPTAIVSGRALEDVQRMVGLSHLTYAGSHGFDVAGPNGIRLQVAQETVPMIRRAAAELRRRTEGIAGVLVEDKHLSLAVHCREVPRSALAGLESTVRAVAAGRVGLRQTHGKRVLELRPDIEWDKGRAVQWILEALNLGGPDMVPLYLGDDVTDRDAFRALAGRGVSVLVGSVPWSSDADYALADVSEVLHFLKRVAALPNAVATASASAS